MHTVRSISEKCFINIIFLKEVSKPSVKNIRDVYEYSGCSGLNNTHSP